MNEIEKSEFSLTQIKKKSSGVVDSISNFVSNAVGIFKKDESAMSFEEKIEKQNLLTFVYGMGAGIVIYHFMVGALLILGIVWFYTISSKKTKNLIKEQAPKKRVYRKRKTKKETEEGVGEQTSIK